MRHRPTMKPATRGDFGALVLATSTLAGCSRAPVTPLAKAADAGDVAHVRQLLESGSDPDDMTRTGLTPLMYAARAGHAPVVQELVRHGARPDLTDTAMTGWTALIHAIHRGQDGAALALLESGAHPDVRVGHGATALLYAAAYGNTAIVRALLERGADPRVPLTHISRSGHPPLKTSRARQDILRRAGPPVVPAAHQTAHWRSRES